MASVFWVRWSRSHRTRNSRALPPSASPRDLQRSAQTQTRRTGLSIPGGSMRRRDVGKALNWIGARMWLGRTTVVVGLMTCFLLSSTSSGMAQLITTGTINGTVTDQSGAVVPHAAIAITNTNTGVAVNTVSNNDGSFSQVGLPTGTYTVTVTMA